MKPVIDRSPEQIKAGRDAAERFAALIYGPPSVAADAVATAPTVIEKLPTNPPVARVAACRLMARSGALRLLRTRARLSQQEMADGLGVTASAYSYYELGRSAPTFEHALQLADLCDALVDAIAAAAAVV